MGDKLTAGLKRAEARLRAFGAGVTRWGTRIFAAGSALAAPALVAAKTFASMGDSVAKAAKRTGMSTEALSELGYAAELSGSNMEDLEKGIRKMQRTITDAATGSKAAEEALAGVGLSARSLEGLAPEDQFTLLAEAVSRVKDPTRRAALAMEIFGRSGTALLPLMEKGAAGMAELRKKGRALGLTISKQDAEAAERLTDALGTLWRVLKQVTFTVGAALAPALSDIAERAATWASSAIKWIGQNRGLIVSLAQLAAGVVAAGAAMIAVGKAITGFAALLGIARIALPALLNPIGLVIVAVGALGAYLLTATTAGGKALDWLGGKFATLKTEARQACQGIGDALAAGDLALAARILWASLKMEWQWGVMALLDVWLDFKHAFLKLAYATWYGALVVVGQVWHGLEVGWIETTSFLSKTWSGFVGFFQRTWEGMKAVAQKAWAWIKGLFDDSISVEAEYARIDQAKADALAKIEDDQARAIAQREQERQRKRDAEEQRHQRLMLSIVKDYEGELDGMAQERTDRMRDAGVEFAAARDEWKQAVADARAKREGKDLAADAGPGKLQGTEGLLDRIGAAAGGLGDQLMTSVRGTFSAAGLFGFGTGSAIERTAAAAEQTAKNTRDMKRLLEDAGMAFE